jgi:4-hydroxy-2-oxoglutarate aldolase
VFLDEAERQTLLEAAADVVPDGALLIAGTGVESTRGTIELSRRAADAGADAVLVQPPAFFKGAMTPEALARHFKTVADASPLPVLVYQVPLRMSTLDLPTGLIEELSHHANIVGIKDSRGKLDLVGELVQHSSDDFQVLVGSGALLYAALETGAVGGIVAVGLLATADAAEITVAYAEGRLADAGRTQERIAPVHQKIVGEMGVPGVKAALDLLGLRGGDPRAPLARASESKIETIRQILADADLLAPARA